MVFSIILYSTLWQAESRPEHLGILRQCDSVHVDHTEYLRIPLFIGHLYFCSLVMWTFPVFFLFTHLEPFHPAFDGPKVVAQVEHPGWLDSRKRPRRRGSQFCHWRITAAVPLVWTWQRGVSHALWADCQEAQGGRGESRNRRVQLSTAKLSNTRQIHLNIWKVLWRCYHYLVRL